jgi:hypothetical protein
MDRLLLTLATLAFAGAVYALMRKGWVSRQGRQADLPAPPVPLGTSDPLFPAVPGLFVGTTGSDDWLDRIAVHDLSHRSKGRLVLCHDGVHISRDGLDDLFVPVGSLEAVSVEESLAGKVVSGGMLVVTWRLGPRSLASAFRADDRTSHVPLRDAIAALISLEAA